MRLEHAVEIDRCTEDVFAFVADPRNDPRWCPRVAWCEQRAGDGVGAGARFEALHSPTLQRTHSRWIEIVAADPPRSVVTRQEDDIALFTITYALEQTSAAGTHLSQRDDIDWKIARPARAVARLIVRRHMADQLRRLKRLLEHGDLASVPGANRA